MTAADFIQHLSDARDCLVRAKREMIGAERAARKADQPIPAESYRTIADNLEHKISAIESVIKEWARKFSLLAYL